MFHVGRDCLCRREAPAPGRFTFPLCWRCTGIAAGIVGLQAVQCLGGLEGFSLALAVALGAVCGFPASADVFCQMAGDYRSNRRRRLATGILLGAGIVLLAHAFIPLFHELF